MQKNTISEKSIKINKCPWDNDEDGENEKNGKKLKKKDIDFLVKEFGNLRKMEMRSMEKKNFFLEKFGLL